MPPRIKRVIIKNFKSFTSSAVDLGPFTMLVGHNGAGKSNFVDALAFVQECVSQSVGQALYKRGGVPNVTHASGHAPLTSGIRLIIGLDDQSWADYSIEIYTGVPGGGLIQERCVLGQGEKTLTGFHTRDGHFLPGKEIAGIRAQLSPDRLALASASAAEEYRPLYDFLTSIRAYNIVPGKIREHLTPDATPYLKNDGSNAASILYAIENEKQEWDRHELINVTLSHIVEGIGTVHTQRVSLPDRHSERSPNIYETVQFNQKKLGDEAFIFSFDPLAVSDGTLRTLAILLALYQPGYHPVIAIEEPEMTIHPAAAEILLQALLDAAHDRQILVTSHSADLLDHKDVKDEQIRVVTMDEGRTVISPMSASSRKIIHDHLYSAGELLRINELSPDLESARSLADQSDLFGPPPE